MPDGAQQTIRVMLKTLGNLVDNDVQLQSQITKLLEVMTAQRECIEALYARIDILEKKVWPEKVNTSDFF